MNRSSSRGKRIWAGVAAAAVLAGTWLKPKEESYSQDSYFESLQAGLKADAIAHPVLIIDLDRVDENLAAIRRVLGADFQFRATTKSLPSYELLEYVLSAMGSRRVMEFHGPFLRPLIERLYAARPSGAPPAPLDILLGKPMPATDLEAFLAAAPAGFGSTVTVRWLIDTPQRLDEYLEIAHRLKVRLDIAFEVDVGLHRGGLLEPALLLSLVEKVKAHPAELRLCGVMGYDGHVPKAPPLFRSTEGAQAAAFAEAMRRLADFVTPLKSRFGELWGSDFVVNSGGSKSYARYRAKDSGQAIGPANELALGSAVLLPADFDVTTLSAHRPAVFIAEPVLKRLSPFQLPFAETLGALWRMWNPNRHDALFVYGGGWSLHPTYPPGLYSNPLYNERPSDNRIPNQILLNCGQHHPLKPGDFVFYRPLESDTLTQFDELRVVRGGKLVATWHPIPHRL